ncbi:MAG: tRNA pseudouridine synthase A, partial [Rickettsiales bacterium]
MPRYKLTLEYDGTGLYGWQRQDEGETGQSLLENAVHAFCGERITSQIAGRTDAGVHALAQVAHIDLTRDWPEFKVMHALNHFLQDTQLSVLKAEQVTEDFHARFSAKGRRYLYRIINRRAPLSLDLGRAWQVPQPLDVDAMNDACSVLLGHHDFTSFRDSDCQAKSPVKTLDELHFERIDGEEIHLHAASR